MSTDNLPGNEPGATNENSATPAGEPTNAPPAAPDTPTLLGGDPTSNPTDPPKGGEPPASTEPEKPATPEAPDKYDFKLPEGMTLDEALQAEFTPIFKDLKLNNEQAQKVVDAYAKKVQADATAYGKVVEGWSEAARNDKEYGGQSFDVNLGHAQAVLARFDQDGSIKQWLHETRLGNHPEMIRIFSRIGKAMAEDTMHGSGTPTSKPTDAAHRMYPNMN